MLFTIIAIIIIAGLVLLEWLKPEKSASADIFHQLRFNFRLDRLQPDEC